jgi:hypothetical protein
MNMQTIATEIAAALGSEWQAVPPQEDGSWRATIKGQNNRMLFLSNTRAGRRRTAGTIT